MKPSTTSSSTRARVSVAVRVPPISLEPLPSTLTISWSGGALPNKRSLAPRLCSTSCVEARDRQALA